MLTAGKNEINNIKALMKLRSVYEKQAYPIRPAIALPFSLNMDFYKLKPFYGRIDTVSNSVANCQIVNGIVNETANLSKVPQTSVRAMNFVVDAFLDMQRFYRNGILTLSGLSSEGSLGDIRAISAWSSPFAGYDTHIQNISNRFISYIFFQDKQSKIVTFTDFIKAFLIFVEDEIKNFPITFSNYVLSRFVNPKISGLVIDTASEDFGDDYLKTSQYIENINFTFYQECTSRFGFYIDQYAPWRLVANIASPKMQEYMQKYSINDSKEIFDKKFVKSYNFDETLLYKLLATVYNNFVTKFPTAIQLKNPNCVEKIERKLVTIQEAKLTFPKEKFIKFYAFLRAREIDIYLGTNAISQNQFNKILLNAQTILSSSTIIDSISFLNNTFNGYASQIIQQDFLTSKSQDAILVEQNLVAINKNERIKISL